MHVSKYVSGSEHTTIIRICINRGVYNYNDVYVLRMSIISPFRTRISKIVGYIPNMCIMYRYLDHIRFRFFLKYVSITSYFFW